MRRAEKDEVMSIIKKDQLAIKKWLKFKVLAHFHFKVLC